MPKESDYCHVCGRKGRLTFEHIPPKSLGNNHGVRSYNVVDVIRAANALDVSARSKARSSKMRRGSGASTLCSECNSYFGTHYVREYTGCIQELGALFIQQPPAEDECFVHLGGAHVNTLAFFKHVISNFCSTTQPRTMLDCKEFLLDKESNDFPSRYRLYMFAVSDTRTVMVASGWTAILTKWGNAVLAHVATYPVGFTLVDVDASDFIPPCLGCDITGMASERWGDRPEFALDLPFMNLDSMIFPVFGKGRAGTPEGDAEKRPST